MKVEQNDKKVPAWLFWTVLVVVDLLITAALLWWFFGRDSKADAAGDTASPPAIGVPADPSDPAVYYAGIDPALTGDALKAALHGLIAGHDALGYGELWDALAYTDQDPRHEGHVVLFYTGWSSPADNHGGGPSNWNREHVWAKSRGGFGNHPPAGTDLHHIRPTDVTVNAARENFAFDDGGELYTDPDGPTGCRVDEDSWEPRDAVKGDVARMVFYMVVRYEDATLDMELTEGAPPQHDRRPLHGVRATLLQWHADDPPDDFERRRNDRIHALQGNRNPFIDHPEWVAVIWGE